MIILQDPDPILLGEEPIFHNNKLVGIVTSGNYGHSLGRSIGLGYISNSSGVNLEYIKSGSFEVQIGLKKYPVNLQFKPAYDPSNEKIKS